MSRFFNETHRNRSQVNGGPRTDSTDLDELVESLRAPSERLRHGSTIVAAEAEERRIIKQDQRASSLIAHGVLQKCRSFSPPSNCEKTFFDLQRTGHRMVAEAYQTLRTRLSRLQTKNGAALIDITGTAQGEGKTLTALNLALCYSLQESRVLLVDADLRTKGLSQKFRLDQFPGLSNILETQCSYESVIARMKDSNFYVLPAGTSLTPPPELLSRSTWTQFAGWARRTFNVIIVDSPPALDFSDFELIAEVCDGVVLVTRSGKTKRQALTRVVEQLDQNKLLGVVLNDSDELSARGYYETYLKSPSPQPQNRP
jgi:capsular exopolysaccharide synthesis family protein